MCAGAFFGMIDGAGRGEISPMASLAMITCAESWTSQAHLLVIALVAC